MVLYPLIILQLIRWTALQSNECYIILFKENEFSTVKKYRFKIPVSAPEELKMVYIVDEL